MKKVSITKKRSLKKKWRKGALGAGMAYAILAMLIVFSAGAMMVGNIFPEAKNPINNQPVIIMTNTPEQQKNNLQLYTFPGATYTPTPTPTPTPTTPPPPANPGGGGGNNAPAGPVAKPGAM